MEEIWIIGVGRFGRLAYERLSERRKKTRFVLVDPSIENLSRCHGHRLSKEAADGVAYLSRHLKAPEGPNWIIPALPIHLAAEWALHILGPECIRRRTIPSEIDPLLPNPMRGRTGDIYVSHATFKCPDDCAEPRDICTVTGKKRKQNMFEILREVVLSPFQSLVIRSHQLGPGIGGYRPAQLRSLREDMKHSIGPFLVSTACRCHGVITGIEKV
ncbi:MAG: potassium transporter [Deltaproteobacteria bacterium]|nr:potassium transporter [Deltaproteobacteria bacterium]